MAFPANVNGWRGDTNLDERIHFDLELMMQHAACITLRDLSHRTHTRGSADRALVAAFRLLYYVAHLRAE